MSELFGERMKRLRVERGMTVDQLAHAIGVTHSIVRRAENGEHQVRAHRLPELARRLNVSIDYLMTGREPDGALRSAILRGTSPDILLAMARREI